MKLALICPTSMLDTFGVQSEGIHLCLVQEVLHDEAYAEFYRKRAEAGDTIILDNGTFEQGHPCSNREIIAAVDCVKANIVVAPDFPDEPCSKTFEASAEFADKLLGNAEDDIKLMIVPHSKKGDIDDWLRGTVALLCNSGSLGSLRGYMDLVTMVGVSILSCPNAFGALVGDDEPEICRFTAFQFLRHALANQSAVNVNKAIKIHCLGAGSRLDLISYYSMAYSLDTSSPIWHGWHGTTYSHGFLPEGKIKTPVDFQAAMPSEMYHGSIQNNIRALKDAARRAEHRHAQ